MVKVGVVGGGGREDVMLRTLLKSSKVEEGFAFPGSDHIGTYATVFRDVKVDDFAGIAERVRSHNIDLLAVGPEAPLVKGIVNYFHQEGLVNEGHLIAGPFAGAAQLEGSKAFAKEVMQEAGVPTAEHEVFDSLAEAEDYVNFIGTPMAVKADGLAGGKGVIIPATKEKTLDAIYALMSEKKFGDAGSRVVVEEILEGDELSVIALTDGSTIRTLLPSQDHKREGEGDTGRNTGGMGAYAPAPIASEELMQYVHDSILVPTIKTMADRGTPFQGCLYAGLMITQDGPKVLEYNVRFGDPEAQVILPLLESDLYELLRACCTSDLDKYEIKNWEGSALTVVAASEGYPGKPVVGRQIIGLGEVDNLPGVEVYHAGTRIDGGYKTSGGRVLAVTGVDVELEGARNKAYQGFDLVHFPGKKARRDIGMRALK